MAARLYHRGLVAVDSADMAPPPVTARKLIADEPRAPTKSQLRLKHAIRRSFDRSIHLAARVLYTVLPGAAPARHGVTLVRDIPYRATGDRAHMLDVYRPSAPSSSGREPRPMVLYVHGGAFSMLSKDTHRVMALSFASRGYVVFNINYRLGPLHKYPAPLEDAAAALLFMVDHAREYGGDPERIILAGESAGANLVTALAYAATHRRPEPFARALYDRNLAIRAALPIYGLLDMHNFERFTAHPRLSRFVKAELVAAGSSYVGHPISQRALAAELASPLRLLMQPAGDGDRPLPPFFAAVGTADPLLDDSRRLKAVLEGRGVPCELAVYPGEIHGFNAMVWRPAARAKWDAVFDFLRRHVT
jgi:acetyl esterase